MTKLWHVKRDENGLMRVSVKKCTLSPTQSRRLGWILITEAANAEKELFSNQLKQGKTELELPEGDMYVDEILEAFEDLPIDNHTIVAVAKHLSLSVRTMQRRLKESGVHFERIRDVVRFQRFVPLIKKEELTIEEISTELGFSDRTSLTNACKRWFKHPPREVRKMLATVAA